MLFAFTTHFMITILYFRIQLRRKLTDRRVINYKIPVLHSFCYLSNILHHVLSFYSLFGTKLFILVYLQYNMLPLRYLPIQVITMYIYNTLLLRYLSLLDETHYLSQMLIDDSWYLSYLSLMLVVDSRYL